jgi:hypothetical protein
MALGQIFSELLRFPLPILMTPTATHSSSSIIRGWYNRPNSGRRTKWTQSHPTPRNKIKTTPFETCFITLRVRISGFHPESLEASLEYSTTSSIHTLFNYFRNIKVIRSRYRSVGIVTGYGLDGRGVGVRVSVGARFFWSPTWPTIQQVPGGGSFPGGKGPRIHGSIHPLPHTSSWHSV